VGDDGGNKGEKGLEVEEPKLEIDIGEVGSEGICTFGIEKGDGDRGGVGEDGINDGEEGSCRSSLATTSVKCTFLRISLSDT
jgi:hypothetical protein